jgi:Phospho-N-acetylmuramoyl-pentapeptide-transferase (EC 2.7.8.13)
MLFWLADVLQEFISGFGMFRYLTLRGILGVMTALGISMLMGPWVIKN